jgi:D-alanine-D-alanine ligase
MTARNHRLPGLRVKEGFLQHPFDKQYGVHTSGLVSGRHLGAGHPHDRHTTAYYGVAPSIFHQLIAKWKESSPSATIKAYTFIDFGAGMGRALLLAAQMHFREVIGVELNPVLARIAKKNLQLWKTAQRSQCPTKILAQEATEFHFPDTHCVAFLFNPFSATVLRRLNRRIAASFEHRPGEIDLLYVNHESETVMKQNRSFAQLWSGDLHKSPEDEAADRAILQNQPEGEYAASEYESCSIYRWRGIPAVTVPEPRNASSASYNQKRMSTKRGSDAAKNTAKSTKISNKSAKESAKPAAKVRVGILFGGRSGEHEVSLLSAASVLNSIDRERYEVVPIGITKEGRWVTSELAEALLTGKTVPELEAPPTDNSRALAAPATSSADSSPQPTALARLLNVDIIFPVLHGTFGEDGTIQGLLELADIAYVGSGVLGSAAGMDKDIMKRLFASAGLPTPKHLAFLRGDWNASSGKIVKQIERALKYPVFVKPANLGSSVGISKVHDRKELGPAIDLAARFDRKIVIEQGIGGSKSNLAGKARELEVAVLGNDSPVASVVGEIIPGKEFYDYEAKYLSDDSVPIIPASLTRKQSSKIQQMAISAFRACDCAGLARVDFLMEQPSKSGKPPRIYVNEINTLPGFTRISMYPKLWTATGLAYPQLIDRLIELAIERRAEKDQTSFSR